jgi:hypothetical protein
LAAELIRSHPAIGVVILSRCAEPLCATELLDDGSDSRAYLVKDRVHHPGDLGPAVRERADRTIGH